MSINRFATDQYTDKSITSGKLADNITIVNLTTGNISSSDCKIVMGDALTKSGSTLSSSNGLIFKHGTTDMVHFDDVGNVYIKGNLEIGGTLNSITTTVNTMEVADYEIVLNAGVSSPYASGARLTVDRGGVNFDSYIGWNETSDYWELYDGTNTARIVDLTYGDARYPRLSAANNFAGSIGFGVNPSAKIHISDANPAIYLDGAAANQSESGRIRFMESYLTNTFQGAFIHYDGIGNIFNIGVHDPIDALVANDVNAIAIARTTGDVTILRDLTISGNRVTFGNGSYIDNEADGTLTVTGDNNVRIRPTSTTPYGSINVAGSGMIFLDNTANTNAMIEFNTANGKIGFGPGTATRDTWLYRDNVNSLKTDGALNVTGKMASGSIQIGTSTTAGYILTADVSGNGTWQVHPADKYLSAVSGTAGGNITFTVANGSNVTWDSAHTHAYLPLTGGTINGNITVNNITFANPGIGSDTRFTFTKSNDNAWLSVKEITSDQTRYEFGMSDNPDSAGDNFAWIITDWKGKGGDWEPLRFENMTASFRAADVNVYGNMTINTPWYSANGIPGTVDSTKTGTLSITPNVAAFSSTTAYYYVEIDGVGTPNTFKWYINTKTGYGTATATLVPITGADQLLNNGVYIRFNATTGGVIGDVYQFRVTKSGLLTVNGNIAVTGNVDGVDIAAFKSAYDTHNHDTAYYTKTNLLTSGQSSVHWGNITNAPADKYLSAVSGTAGGTITFTVANGSNITWDSAHAHNYLPLTGGSVSGALNLNSNTDTTPLKITRDSATSNEFMAIGVTDANCNFYYSNDEATSFVRFRMQNTDTESGGGVLASDREVLTLKSSNVGGYVGILQTAPAYPLDVNGTVSCSGFKLGTSTTAGYVLTASTTGVGTWTALPTVPADKYLSAVAGTAGGTITFTITNGSNVTWDSSHSHTYLPLAGGTLTGELTFQDDGEGITLYGASRIYKASGSGLKIKPHNDAIGVAITNVAGADHFVVKTDGSGITYNGNAMYHAGNMTYGKASIDSSATADYIGAAYNDGTIRIDNTGLDWVDGGNYITISHKDTSTQASVTLSGGAVVQSVNLDAFGHVTSLSGTDLDTRYFTQTEMHGSLQAIRNIMMCGGGALSWTAGTLTWDEAFEVLLFSGYPMPDQMKFVRLTSTAGGSASLSARQCMYLTIPAAGSSDMQATMGLAPYDDPTIFTSNDKIVLFFADGDGSLILRNGIVLPPNSTYTSSTGLVSSYAPASHATNGSTYGYGDGTVAGHVRKGNGIAVSNGTFSVASHAGTAGTVGTVVVGTNDIGVSLGTTSTTACAGNDTRLTNSRTPTAHGDSVHNHQKFARVTYAAGSSNIAYQWNHGLNSANVVFTITANSPETHFYYSTVDANNVKIYLDDVPYEAVILDVTATLPNALTAGTANLTS